MLHFISDPFGAVPSSQGRACLFPLGCARGLHPPELAAFKNSRPGKRTEPPRWPLTGLQHWAQSLAESEQAVPALRGGHGWAGVAPGRAAQAAASVVVPSLSGS